MFNTLWNELGLKRWFYFLLTCIVLGLIVYGILSAISNVTSASSMPLLAIAPIVRINWNKFGKLALFVLGGWIVIFGAIALLSW